PMSRVVRALLTAGFAALLVAGCGNKGPLVLPDQPEQSAKHKKKAPADAKPADTKPAETKPAEQNTQGGGNAGPGSPDAPHRRAPRADRVAAAPMTLRFTKMQGAGNDFVVVDCRTRPLGLDATQIARAGDRHFGVGFDQLLTIEPASDGA